MGWQSTTKTDPERQVEKYLVDKVHNLGGIAWKFTSPGTAGVPDRIVALNGMICFVELKRPVGGRTSNMQKWRIKQLHDQGQHAYVLKNKDQINYLIEHLMRGEYPS